MRFSQRRSKSGLQFRVGKRASVFSGESRGRPVRFKIPKDYPRRNLAFLPSVRAAIISQGANFPLKLQLQDLRVWIRQGKAPLNIVLIADVSASTYHFLEPAAHIISILYRDAYRNRDQMGLVAIQEGKAKIVNHPTRNLQMVLGNLIRLSPCGLTPLAEALGRTLEVFKKERRRQAFINPLAVLLSDCHPEPIHRTKENMLDEPLYRQVMNLAVLFRRENIPIVVINPAHGRFSKDRLWWGTQLAIKIAGLSGGKYYGISPNRYDKFGGFIDETLWRKQLLKQKANVDAKNIKTLLRDFQDRPISSFLDRE